MHNSVAHKIYLYFPCSPVKRLELALIMHQRGLLSTEALGSLTPVPLPLPPLLFQHTVFARLVAMLQGPRFVHIVRFVYPECALGQENNSGLCSWAVSAERGSPPPHTPPRSLCTHSALVANQEARAECRGSGDHGGNGLVCNPLEG